VVVVTHGMDLPANLARLELLRMDIPVHGIGRQRGNDRGEVAGGMF
jgi:hypothetical protein